MHYYYREEAYKARVQLAVMDHNFHLGREQRTSPSVPDRCQYRRVYRKSSQNWGRSTSTRKEELCIPGSIMHFCV